MKKAVTGSSILRVPGSYGPQGLSFDAGNPLFKKQSGVQAALHAGIASQQVSTALSSLGLVVTPTMSLATAVASLSSVEGGRLLLAPGTWDFPATGLTISKDNVELVALCPGHTFFRSRVSADPMLTITGDYCRIEGITFVDQVGSSLAMHVRGSYTTVTDCIFLEGGGVKVSPISPGTITGTVVRDCLFGPASTAGIEITGVSDLCQILDNRIMYPSASIKIASTSTTNTLIVGNTVAGGIISYPFGYGTVEMSNIPSGGAFAFDYTLTDNTAAPTDVGVDILWPVSKVYGVSLKYSLWRGATPDIATGTIDLVMNSTECLAYADYQTTTVNPGVLFYGRVSAGFAYLQYTTTGTGQDAHVKFTVEQERTY